MILRLCVLAIVVGLTGCGPNLRAASSGQVGCPEDEIEIRDEESGWGTRTWTATCHDRVFYCSSAPAGEHGGQYSCTAAIDGGDRYRREHDNGKPVAPPPEPAQGPVAVTRTLEFYGGGKVGVRGTPSENGGRLELYAELVRDPVTVASWSECMDGQLVADDASYPLQDVSVRAADGGKPTTLRATAKVGVLIRVVKAKQKAAIVACGQQNWLDQPARRTLFALLQEFKGIAERSGTWDPSLEPAATAAAAPAPAASSPLEASEAHPQIPPGAHAD